MSSVVLCGVGGVDRLPVGPRSPRIRTPLVTPPRTHARTVRTAFQLRSRLGSTWRMRWVSREQAGVGDGDLGSPQPSGTLGTHNWPCTQFAMRPCPKSIICHVFLDTSWNPHGLRMR